MAGASSPSPTLEPSTRGPYLSIKYSMSSRILCSAVSKRAAIFRGWATPSLPKPPREIKTRAGSPLPSIDRLLHPVERV